MTHMELSIAGDNFSIPVPKSTNVLVRFAPHRTARTSLLHYVIDSHPLVPLTEGVLCTLCRKCWCSLPRVLPVLPQLAMCFADTYCMLDLHLIAVGLLLCPSLWQFCVGLAKVLLERAQADRLARSHVHHFAWFTSNVQLFPAVWPFNAVHMGLHRKMTMPEIRVLTEAPSDVWWLMRDLRRWDVSTEHIASYSTTRRAKANAWCLCAR